MTSQPEAQVSMNLGQPAPVIWERITDPHRFHGLFIPGVYSAYDTTEPRKGSVTFYQSMGGGPRYPRYVCDYEPFTRFSFGISPTEWTFLWTLQANGPSTTVTFRRRFAKPSFFDRLFDRSTFNQKTYDGMVQETMNRLATACQKLSAGEQDGIFRTGP